MDALEVPDGHREARSVSIQFENERHGFPSSRRLTPAGGDLGDVEDLPPSRSCPRLGRVDRWD